MSHAWYVVSTGGERGPISGAQLKQLAADGEIDAATLVRRDDLDEPRPASRIKGLIPAQAVAEPVSARAAAVARRGQHRREVNKRKVRNAGRWLLAIGILLALHGTSEGLGVKTVVDQAKAEVDAEFSADDWLEVAGEEMTVTEFKSQMDAEVLRTFLAVYLVAAIMIGLYFWARSSPLPAIVTGLCVYLVLVAVQAVVEPGTLLSGLFWKFFIISGLLAGIRAAMAQQVSQRRAEPGPT